MVDRARARRLAVRIREIVADTVERQVKDPRLGMVTFTDARVTPDLREAKVFYTVYGGDADRAGSAVALESAKGVLRSAVGKATGVRYTPSLEFVADHVPETANRVAELIAQALQSDAELQRAHAGAVPAGDPDPYRVPRVVEDDDEDEDDDDEDPDEDPDEELDSVEVDEDEVGAAGSGG